MPHCSGSQTCFCPSVPEGGTWFVGDSTLQSLLALWGQSHDWFSFTFCIQMPNPEPGNSQAHSRSSVRGCWGELAGLFVIHHCILTTEQNPGPEFNTGQISEWISNVKKKIREESIWQRADTIQTWSVQAKLCRTALEERHAITIPN